MKLRRGDKELIDTKISSLVNNGVVGKVLISQLKNRLAIMQQLRLNLIQK